MQRRQQTCRPDVATDVLQTGPLAGTDNNGYRTIPPEYRHSCGTARIYFVRPKLRIAGRLRNWQVTETSSTAAHRSRSRSVARSSPHRLQSRGSPQVRSVSSPGAGHAGRYQGWAQKRVFIHNQRRRHQLWTSSERGSGWKLLSCAAMASRSGAGSAGWRLHRSGETDPMAPSRPLSCRANERPRSHVITPRAPVLGPSAGPRPPAAPQGPRARVTGPLLVAGSRGACRVRGTCRVPPRATARSYGPVADIDPATRHPQAGRTCSPLSRPVLSRHERALRPASRIRAVRWLGWPASSGLARGPPGAAVGRATRRASPPDRSVTGT